MLLSNTREPIVVNSLGWLKVITCSFKHNNERMMMRRRAKKVERMFRIMQRLRHMFSHRFCIRSQFLLDGFLVVISTPARRRSVWKKSVKNFQLQFIIMIPFCHRIPRVFFLISRSHILPSQKKYEIFFGWNLFAWVLLRWSRRHLRTRGAGLEEIFWGLHATFSRAASSPLMYHSPSEILTCELFAWKPERCEGGLGSGKKFFPTQFF